MYVLCILLEYVYNNKIRLTSSRDGVCYSSPTKLNRRHHLELLPVEDASSIDSKHKQSNTDYVFSSHDRRTPQQHNNLVLDSA